jgi:putative two-component system response regulator
MERYGANPGTMLASRGERKPVAVCIPAQTPRLSSLPPSDTEGVLLSLTRVVEQRDAYTAAHSKRLACTAVALGVAMQLDSASLQTLYIGGSLHDIGKVGIPDSILFKPGKLTQEEWRIMRSHPVLGEEICRPFPALRPVLPVIRHHHERWDGTGYPDGLRGADIPLLARVLQMVDIYDALTNPRSYRGAASSAHALEVLQEETARGWRAPDITSLFVSMHRRMFSKIAHCKAVADPTIDSMGNSVHSLQTYLAG